MFGNFSRKEFACNDGCGFDTVDAELLMVLNDVRNHFNRPVHVNSGCRCPYWNALQGGAKNSQHLLGRAADIRVEGIDPFLVYSYLNDKYPTKLGLGEYSTFTHVDTRTNCPARWKG